MATKKFDEINTFLISHKYETISRIKKLKSGRRIRTTADEGGQGVIGGLEFTSLANVNDRGELEEFTEILKLLEKTINVKSVYIIIRNLPEGRKGKRFSKLNHRITRRR